jgi:light-regulated signal transduction histidine kinase (bacteriophytochrome)
MKKLANKAGQHKIDLQALKESEARFRSIVLWSPDAIIVTDAKGKIEYMNPAAERVFNRKMGSFVGKDFGLPLVDGESTEIDIFRPGKDSGVGDMHVVEAEWLNEKAHVITIRDITERKQAEEALKKTMADLERSNKELEQFAYLASHDLQEPLRMVASYVQLLAKRYQDKLDADANEFIGYAVDGANRMQEMINDLLSYSRIETRGKPFETVDCTAILNQALTNLKIAIEESSAVITHNPLPTMTGDESQLIQLFQNLIGNAVKFRGKETPHIHISCKSIEEWEVQNRGLKSEIRNLKSKIEKGWVFSVRDNGIGIDPQHKERVFNVFQRLHGRDYSGTGIGLSICKRVVERYGGKIWVESEPEKGSTFYFTIPDRHS